MRTYIYSCHSPFEHPDRPRNINGLPRSVCMDASAIPELAFHFKDHLCGMFRHSRAAYFDRFEHFLHDPGTNKCDTMGTHLHDFTHTYLQPTCRTMTLVIFLPWCLFHSHEEEKERACACSRFLLSLSISKCYWIPITCYTKVTISLIPVSFCPKSVRPSVASSVP